MAGSIAQAFKREETLKLVREKRRNKRKSLGHQPKRNRKKETCL